MKTICILSGTDRPGSVALKVANYIKPRYEAQGVDVRVVSLEDFPLEEAIGGKYGKELPRIEAFRNEVIEADGIVMVIPEYNGSFPGILKLFIDYLPFPDAFFKKPIAFIGEASGAFGGLRAVEQMQMICAYRNAHLYPERVFLQRVKSIFDEEDGIKDGNLSKLLHSQVEGFVQFVNRAEEMQLT
jgi:chromate reductase, NAD(P)H dehydrogenase (quinone)